MKRDDEALLSALTVSGKEDIFDTTPVDITGVGIISGHKQFAALMAARGTITLVFDAS